MDTKKKIIYGVIVLAALAVIAFGISRGTEKAPQVVDNTEQDDPCAVDISAIILEDLEGMLKTDEEIVTAMFNHYFSAYTTMQDCPGAGLKSFKLTSLGKINRIDETNLTGEIVFELEPISMEKTEWDTEETKIEGSWIKNKKGMLSIRESNGRYYLML